MGELQALSLSMKLAHNEKSTYFLLLTYTWNLVCKQRNFTLNLKTYEHQAGKQHPGNTGGGQRRQHFAYDGEAYQRHRNDVVREWAFRDSVHLHLIFYLLTSLNKLFHPLLQVWHIGKWTYSPIPEFSRTILAEPHSSYHQKIMTVLY